MTLADALDTALTGLLNDPNFGMPATILIRTPTKDKYGNRLNTAHTTIQIQGFFDAGRRPSIKKLDPRGVEPEVAPITFFTNDLTTPISLKDKFLYNRAYYNITNIMLFNAGSQTFMRRLTLEASKVKV